MSKEIMARFGNGQISLNASTEQYIYSPAES